MTCGLVGHGSNRCATTHLYFIKRKPMIFLLYPGGPGQEKASYIETLAIKEKVLKNLVKFSLLGVCESSAGSFSLLEDVGKIPQQQQQQLSSTFW